MGAKMLTYFDVDIVNPTDVNVASSTKEGPFECSFCSSDLIMKRVSKFIVQRTTRVNCYMLRVESLNGLMNTAEPSGTLCNVCDRKFYGEEAVYFTSIRIMQILL